MKIAQLVWILFFSSCFNSQNSIKEVTLGDTILTVSMFNGKPSGEAVYKLNGKTISRSIFENGKKNGLSVGYYLNGVIKDSAFYIDDKRNGDFFVFDSLGNIEFQYHYVNDTLFGPIYEYKNRVLKSYKFRTEEQKLIFISNYDSSGRWIESGGDFPYAESYKLNENKIGVLVYFPSPPGLEFSYFLGLYSERLQEKKDEVELISNRVYLDTFLRKPEIGWKYYVSLQYLDSIANNVHEKMKILSQ